MLKEEQPLQVMSLGHSCGVAKYLREWGLLSMDNMLSNMISRNLENVVKFIDHKGKDLFSDVNTQWQERQGNSAWWAYDTKYDFLSVHDVSLKLNGKERIAELQKIKHEQSDVFFKSLAASNLLIVRNNRQKESLETIVQLYEAISKFRNGRSFTLCVLQNKEFPKLKMPGLEIYKTEDAYFDMKLMTWIMGDSWKLAFKAILQKIKQHNSTFEIPTLFDTNKKMWIHPSMLDWDELWTKIDRSLGRAYAQFCMTHL